MGSFHLLGFKITPTNMNKIITCFLAIVLLFVVFSVASTAEETNPAEDSSSLRQVRAAERRTAIKRKGRKSSKAMKEGKAKARRKAKKAKEGRPDVPERQKIGRKKEKSSVGRKKKGKKRGSKRMVKEKKGSRKQTQRQRQVKSTSRAGAMCLSVAVKYMKQWKDVVTNFRKQEGRATKHAELGGKKSGKKEEFAPTAYRLVEVGGDNSSNLSCGGEFGNEGAKKLANLTTDLFACEATVASACTMPELNATLVANCTSLLDAFENATEMCMMKTIGKTTDAEYTEACTCWEDSSLATMSSRLSDCAIKTAQQNITKQKTACVKAFSTCKGYLLEANEAMASCTTSADKLTAKATALATNNETVTAAKEKMSSLAGNSSRRARQTATSCAEVITKSQSLTVMISQSPSSSSISVVALEISSSSVTVCSDTEKSSLTTEISSVNSALAMISEALAAVQS